MSDGNFSIAHVAFVKIFVQLSNASKLADQIGGPTLHLLQYQPGGSKQVPMAATGDRWANGVNWQTALTIWVAAPHSISDKSRMLRVGHNVRMLSRVQQNIRVWLDMFVRIPYKSYVSCQRRLALH